MSDITTLGNAITKFKNNQYDKTILTAEDFEILQEYAPALLGLCTKLVQEGSKVQERVFNILDKVTDSFADQLKNPNLTPEERKELNAQMERMADRAMKKDTEYKQWVYGGLTVAVGAVVGFWAKNKFGKR